MRRPGRRNTLEPAALITVLQTQYVVIDALIRSLQIAVRDVLITITNVVLPLATKAHAGADMITELKTGAELSLFTKIGLAQKMKSNGNLAIGGYS